RSNTPRPTSRFATAKSSPPASRPARRMPSCLAISPTTRRRWLGPSAARATTPCWAISTRARARLTWRRCATPIQQSKNSNGGRNTGRWAMPLTDSERAALVPDGLTHHGITQRIAAIVLRQPAPRAWLVGVGICFVLTLIYVVSVSYVFATGIGLFGMNIPVAWGLQISNTIWWIGIAHAGTLISAVLLLTRQPWRASINRFAEGMAMFAIVCAGMYPLIHLGRPWLFFYVMPYPNSMNLWPQWRSPLVWDFFAIGMYLLFTMT